MYMKKQDIDQLIIAFLEHSISEEDAERLFMWVNEQEQTIFTILPEGKFSHRFLETKQV